jgi:hypothetical protein
LTTLEALIERERKIGHQNGENNVLKLCPIIAGNEIVINPVNITSAHLTILAEGVSTVGLLPHHEQKRLHMSIEAKNQYKNDEFSKM